MSGGCAYVSRAYNGDFVTHEMSFLD
jgi:hypothetical protein